MLIDDHAIVREGVRAVLEQFTDIIVVAEASNAEQALQILQSQAVDVVFSDLRMPGTNVVAAIRAIRSLRRAPQVVVFSSFSEAVQVRAVLEAGAIGYLTKDASASEIRQTILSAHLGLDSVHPQIRALLRNSPQTADARQALSILAPRERDVLFHLAQAKSNKEIARALNLTEGTVKAYVVNIFHKLDVSDRTEAALFAHRAGLLDPL